MILKRYDEWLPEDWLLLAAESGYAAGVRSLAARGADVNATDADGEAPLIKAVYGGHVQAVEALLQAGANPNARDAMGLPALSMAVRCGHIALIQPLLHAGAGCDVTDMLGRTPLLWSVESDCPYACYTLLDNGAAPDIADRNGETPLQRAVALQLPKLVEALLLAGADAALRDAHGVTPEQRARAEAYNEVIILLAGAAPSNPVADPALFASTDQVPGAREADEQPCCVASAPAQMTLPLGLDMSSQPAKQSRERCSAAGPDDASFRPAADRNAPSRRRTGRRGQGTPDPAGQPDLLLLEI